MGVRLRKKTKDLSASEREERGHGKGGSVNVVLKQSDTVKTYGRVKEVTSPGGVKKKSS